jgi:hypothetical protein
MREAALPGPVGVPAGEIGEQAATHGGSHPAVTHRF